MSRRLTSVLALVLALVVLLPGGAARAHGGAAVLEVVSAAEVAGGDLELRLSVRHEADGHPADGAIVDVEGAGPGGAVSEAVRLARTAEPGVYAATVPVPVAGRWTLAVTSSFPPGDLRVPVDVAGSGPATSTTGSATPSPLPELEAPEAGGAEGGSDPTNLVVAAVGGVVGGALGLWASRRRSARRRA